MKHDFMMRTRIALSQRDDWSGAAFDRSLSLSAFIRFSADLVAAGMSRPDEIRGFASELLGLINQAHDASNSPEVHQHLEEASRLLLNLKRLGA